MFQLFRFHTFIHCLHTYRLSEEHCHDLIDKYDIGPPIVTEIFYPVFQIPGEQNGENYSRPVHSLG